MMFGFDTEPEIFETNQLKVTMWPLGPLQTNCFMLQLKGANHSSCLIVDAGAFPDRMIDQIKSAGLTPQKLLLTHAHIDHIAGIPAVYDAFGVSEKELPMYGHEAQKMLLENPNLNLSMQHGMPMTITRDLSLLNEGDQFAWEGIEIEVYHVPGHSPGSLCYHLPQEEVVFVGDTLFAGSIGRTDLPMGDHTLLIHGIRQKLFFLPGSTRVCPGHNQMTRIDIEKKTNPYLNDDN